MYNFIIKLIIRLIKLVDKSYSALVHSIIGFILSSYKKLYTLIYGFLLILILILLNSEISINILEDYVTTKELVLHCLVFVFAIFLCNFFTPIIYNIIIYFWIRNSTFRYLVKKFLDILIFFIIAYSISISVFSNLIKVLCFLITLFYNIIIIFIINNFIFLLVGAFIFTFIFFYYLKFTLWNEKRRREIVKKFLESKNIKINNNSLSFYKVSNNNSLSFYKVSNNNSLSFYKYRDIKKILIILDTDLYNIINNQIIDFLTFLNVDWIKDTYILYLKVYQYYNNNEVVWILLFLKCSLFLVDFTNNSLIFWMILCIFGVDFYYKDLNINNYDLISNVEFALSNKTRGLYKKFIFIRDFFLISEKNNKTSLRIFVSTKKEFLLFLEGFKKDLLVSEKGLYDNVVRRLYNLNSNMLVFLEPNTDNKIYDSGYFTEIGGFTLSSKEILNISIFDGCRLNYNIKLLSLISDRYNITKEDRYNKDNIYAFKDSNLFWFLHSSSNIGIKELNCSLRGNMVLGDFQYVIPETLLKSCNYNLASVISDQVQNYYVTIQPGEENIRGNFLDFGELTLIRNFNTVRLLYNSCTGEDILEIFFYDESFFVGKTFNNFTYNFYVFYIFRPGFCALPSLIKRYNIIDDSFKDKLLSDENDENRILKELDKKNINFAVFLIKKKILNISIVNPKGISLFNNKSIFPKNNNYRKSFKFISDCLQQDILKVKEKGIKQRQSYGFLQDLIDFCDYEISVILRKIKSLSFSTTKISFRYRKKLELSQDNIHKKILIDKYGKSILKDLNRKKKVFGIEDKNMDMDILKEFEEDFSEEDTRKYQERLLLIKMSEAYGEFEKDRETVEDKKNSLVLRLKKVLNNKKIIRSYLLEDINKGYRLGVQICNKNHLEYICECFKKGDLLNIKSINSCLCSYKFNFINNNNNLNTIKNSRCLLSLPNSKFLTGLALNSYITIYDSHLDVLRGDLSWYVTQNVSGYTKYKNILRKLELGEDEEVNIWCREDIRIKEYNTYIFTYLLKNKKNINNYNFNTIGALHIESNDNKYYISICWSLIYNFNIKEDNEKNCHNIWSFLEKEDKRVSRDIDNKDINTPWLSHVKEKDHKKSKENFKGITFDEVRDFIQDKDKKRELLEMYYASRNWIILIDSFVIKKRFREREYLDEVRKILALKLQVCIQKEPQDNIYECLSQAIQGEVLDTLTDGSNSPIAFEEHLEWISLSLNTIKLSLDDLLDKQKAMKKIDEEAFYRDFNDRYFYIPYDSYQLELKEIFFFKSFEKIWGIFLENKEFLAKYTDYNEKLYKERQKSFNNFFMKLRSKIVSKKKGSLLSKEIKKILKKEEL